MSNPLTVTSSNAATPQTAAARTARVSGDSFAQAHAAAVSATKDKDKTSDAPKGERTQKVAGHNYMEIVSGPRNGMFINNSGNSRDGDAFLIVKRHGREFHIYGTGPDRSVYEVGSRERQTTRAPGTTGGGTTGTGTTPATGTTGTGTTGTTPATGPTGTTPSGGGTATT